MGLLQGGIQMTNDNDNRKQNRDDLDDLLERMSESGNAHSSEYPYGLMMEAEEEIKRLRAERDELKLALAKYDELAKYDALAKYTRQV